MLNFHCEKILQRKKHKLLVLHWINPAFYCFDDSVLLLLAIGGNRQETDAPGYL